MTIYRSKPTEIEAMLWQPAQGSSELERRAQKIVNWVNANGGEAYYTDGPLGPKIAICTINGESYVAPGHYVVMGTTRFPVSGTAYINGVPSDVLRDFQQEDPETFEKRWEKASECYCIGPSHRMSCPKMYVQYD